MLAAEQEMLRAADEGDLDGMCHGYETNDWLLEAEGETGLRPLHLAVKRGDVQATNLLLGLGADVTAKDHRGWTPLHVALGGESAKVASALLQHIDGLVQKGTLEVTELDAAAYDNGLTPLHFAVGRRDEGAVRALVSFGVDLNRSDPLHTAVRYGYLQVGPRLLFSKAYSLSFKRQSGFHDNPETHSE
jgi:ankyrin repeat protein